jgi:uncharacterized membrane protein YqjE
LDLAFFLPAVGATGVLLLRRHPLGYVTAVGQLVWIGLTCLPILVTLMVAQVRGHSPSWFVAVPIGVLLLASLAVIWRLLRSMSSQTGEARPSGTDPSRW